VGGRRKKLRGREVRKDDDDIGAMGKMKGMRWWVRYQLRIGVVNPLIKNNDGRAFLITARFCGEENGIAKSSTTDYMFHSPTRQIISGGTIDLIGPIGSIWAIRRRIGTIGHTADMRAATSTSRQTKSIPCMYMNELEAPRSGNPSNGGTHDRERDSV
jgi:hypothetical protein